MRIFRLSLNVLLAASIAVAAGAVAQDNKETKKPVKKLAGTILDPMEAGLTYEVQGEYAGTFKDGGKLGCQIIALSEDRFQAVLLAGGLPGDGWDGTSRILMDGKLDGDKAAFVPTKGKRKYMAGSPSEFSATAMFPPKGQIDCSAALANGTLSGKTEDGKSFELKKTTRTSPTQNAKPPEGAIVLFDGTNASEWKEGKITGDLLPVAATTKRNFKDFKLHIEFRTPFQPGARSQGRGNSGVYLHGNHEIQVLDSFGLDGKNNECGAFYSRKEPSVHMCYPPLAWQTYDVELTSDKKTAHATVLHNGVKIHDKFELPSGEGPFHLQNHGNPVFYRNVWVVELK